MPPNAIRGESYDDHSDCNIFLILIVHLVLSDSRMWNSFVTNIPYILGPLFFFYLSYEKPHFYAI